MDSLDAIAAHNRPLRLARDAEATRVTEQETWDTLSDRIEQARAKIKRLGQEGW